METESTDPVSNVVPSTGKSAADKLKRATTRQAGLELDNFRAKIDVLYTHLMASRPPSKMETEARVRRDDDDALHARTEKAFEAQHRRSQERLVMIFGLGVVGLGAIISAGTLLFRPYTEAPWAPPVLTLIVGGLVGFVERGKLN